MALYNDDFYLSKLKQFNTAASKLLIQARGFKQLENDPHLEQFLVQIDPFLKKIRQEIVDLGEHFQLAVEIGHSRKPGGHARSQSGFFTGAQGSLTDDVLVRKVGKPWRIQLVIATLPPLVCVKNFNRTFIV